MHDAKPREGWQRPSDTACAGMLVFAMFHLLISVMLIIALINWSGDQALLPLALLGSYWAGALLGFDAGRQ